MDKLLEAVEMDALDRPFEASEAYERAILERRYPLGVYLDLLSIYLSIQDPGFHAYHHIPDEFINRADIRYHELLDNLEEQFGSSDTIDFWRHYYRWKVYLDEEGTAEKLMEIYLRDSVPEACVAVNDEDDNRRHHHLHRLSELCRDGKSQRQRYFHSLAKAGLALEREKGKLGPE